MYEPQINNLAVLIAALAHFLLGTLWYSPVLFGKAWIGAMGLPDAEVAKMKEKGPGAKPFIITFIGTLIMVYVTAHMVDFMKIIYQDMDALLVGLISAFWLWLGYIATFALTGVAYEDKSWKLYSINVSYQLLGLLIVGSILAVWV